MPGCSADKINYYEETKIRLLYLVSYLLYTYIFLQKEK